MILIHTTNSIDEQNTILIIDWLKYFNKSWIKISGESEFVFSNLAITKSGTKFYFLNPSGGRLIDISEIKAVFSRNGLLRFNNHQRSELNILTEQYTDDNKTYNLNLQLVSIFF